MNNVIHLYPSPKTIRGSKHDVSPDLLQAYWAGIRCTGPDFFATVIYDGETQQVQHGWMPQGNDYSLIDLRRYNDELEELKCLLEQKLETAVINIKKRQISMKLRTRSFTPTACIVGARMALLE